MIGLATIQPKCIKCYCNLILAINWTEARAKASHYICNVCSNKKSRLEKLQIRDVVFSHYGKKCECCEFSDLDCLTIDHINEDGDEQREALGIYGGHQFYYWIVKNEFPNYLRTLCYNCNICLSKHGYCPHTASRIYLSSQFTNCGNICRYCAIELNTNNSYNTHLNNGRHICMLYHSLEQSNAVFRMKSKVFSVYGNECRWCKENKLEFLAIDHINNDGAKDRKTNGYGAGARFYRWLMKSNFPQDNFQILCHNCNYKKELLVRRGLYE